MPVSRYRQVLLLVLIISVAFESTRAPTINNNIIPHLDKGVHFFVFGLIAWLIAVVLNPHLSTGISTLLAFMLSTLFGLANEWIQAFTLGRCSDLNDVLADMAGAVIFLLIWFASAWYKNKWIAPRTKRPLL